MRAGQAQSIIALARTAIVLPGSTSLSLPADQIKGRFATFLRQFGGTAGRNIRI